jgi:hypothetical protein
MSPTGEERWWYPPPLRRIVGPAEIWLNQILSSHCWYRPERIAPRLGRITRLTARPRTAEAVRPLWIYPQVGCRPLPPFSVVFTNVLTLKGPSLNWTEWRARLSLPGGERTGSSSWPWRDAGLLVVGWLRVVASRCGQFSLFRRLTSAAGSLTPVVRTLVSYTLPASRTRPNAAWHCYAPCWLARRQDSRRMALGVKLLCGRIPHCYPFH